MKMIEIVVIGAGGRGFEYSRYLKDFPGKGRVIAVAEPDPDRRSSFAALHGIKQDFCFESWETMLSKGKLADAVLIATQDDMHFAPAIKAMEQGYHILLEKPMSNRLEECLRLGELSRKYDKVFSICHVLRYTKFFSTIKTLLENGRIGRLVSIQHNENVGYFHHVHSYVRGSWRNSEQSSPMILAKSCHDMDIMLWLAGADCLQLSSYGSLMHFKEINAPEGSASRCLDGCAIEQDCPYSAKKIYKYGTTGWPVSVITHDYSMEGISDALKNGPYGRCVYRCDNNVVDHQVVCMEFENGVTAAFTMCAFTPDISRTIKLMGTEGEIRGHMERNEIELARFIDGRTERIMIDNTDSRHGGGDFALMKSFVESVGQEGRAKETLTNAGLSVQSHIMAFAAELSRITGKNIILSDFIDGYSCNNN